MNEVYKFKVTLRQMITIIHRTINSSHTTLLNHGEEVAYIMMNMLKMDGSYSEDEIIKICAISIFHDIGIYKVTERDKIMEADTISPLKHAVYGSLFIKYFSPLSDLHKIILSHHFSPRYYREKNMDIISKEGLLLNFVDNLDRTYLKNNLITREYYENSSEEFLVEHIELFKKADKEFNLVSKLINGTYIEELYDFFDKKIITREEVIAYSKMLAYSIDFRSEATVRHTITVEAISYQIGKLYGLDENKLTRIKVASALHDIGKIGIPVEILEKPGNLTKEEFEIIKSHAIIGYSILSGLGIDDIRDIGTLHHEKLDGAGYPFGLREDKLSKEVRIVAISDIISALLGSRSYKGEFTKDKTIKILKDMARANKIDYEITKLFIDNYDYLINGALAQCSDLMEIYLNIKNEYKYLINTLS